MRDESWYWSLSQHKVVRAGEAKAEDVLGPYATREEAAGALDKVKARNDRLDAEELAAFEESIADLPAAEQEERRAAFLDKKKFG